MKEVAVIVPRKGGGRMPTVSAIERLLKRSGLGVTLRGTLARYPGCTHWHLKNGSERGVLELTHWPGGKRLWFSIQAGRRGDWVMRSARAIKAQLELKVANSKR
jgi:hypothetical protein